MRAMLVGAVFPLALFCSACGGTRAVSKAAGPSSETVTCVAHVGLLTAPGRHHTLQFPTPTDDPSGVTDFGIEWLAILKLRAGGNVHIARTYAKADAHFLARWGEGGTVYTRGVTKDLTHSATATRVIRHPERRGVQAGIYALFWSTPPTARQSAALLRCLDQTPSPRVRPPTVPALHA